MNDPNMPGHDSGAPKVAPPETLPELIAELEADQVPRSEHAYAAAFLALARQLQEAGALVPRELVAEHTAFNFHANYPDNDSGWGLYFGPVMTGAAADGTPWEIPNLADVTPEMLDYWRARADSSTHPVMRARYADLLWELPAKLSHIAGVRRDAQMAVRAVESYLDAVATRRYEHETEFADKARRALEISLMLGSDDLVTRARIVMIALEAAAVADEAVGLWAFSFDDLIEKPHKRFPLNGADRDGILHRLAERLARLAAREPNKYHPSPAEAAALRLARYYRRAKRPEDVRRVLGVYRAVVLAMRGVADPMVAAYSLERLYGVYIEFDLRDEADALNEPLRTLNAEAASGMKSQEFSVEIPAEKVEEMFAWLLTAPTERALLRIAVEFLPQQDSLAKRLETLSQESPITFLFPRAIKATDGRTVAHVGGLEDDFEGHLLELLTHEVASTTPLLFEAMSRGLESGLISVGGIVALLAASPVFLEDRRPLVEAGVRAFVAGDYVAAIHLLIPQIEQALRQLAAMIGAPTYTPRRSGGMHARILDDLLRDDALKQVLGENIIEYLRAILTDARSWNLRNTVCHGLAPAGAFNPGTAVRVLHCLLLVSLVRGKEAATSDSTPAGGDEAPVTSGSEARSGESGESPLGAVRPASA